LRVSFLSVRPIVLSLARSTMFSCTTAVSSSVSVHRLRPFGGGEQASAISLASAAPSKMRFGGVGRVLAGQGGFDPSLHQLLMRAGDGVDAGVQCFGDPPIAPGFAGLRGIGLQQDACLQHLPCRTCALLYQRVEALPLVSAQHYDVSLYGRLSRDHDASPGNRRYRSRDWPHGQRRSALGAIPGESDIHAPVLRLSLGCVVRSNGVRGAEALSR
jgi:hypothetical protein